MHSKYLNIRKYYKKKSNVFIFLLLTCTGTNLIPAGSNISRASINADPTIPNIFLVPWATIVSTKASLDVIFVGTVLHSGLASADASWSLKQNGYQFRSRWTHSLMKNKRIYSYLIFNCNINWLIFTQHTRQLLQMVVDGLVFQIVGIATRVLLSHLGYFSEASLKS